MGLLGIYNVPNVSTALYYGIHNLQHRGQEGAGMATFDENGKCLRHRGLGLVAQLYIFASFVKNKVSIGAWIYLWAFYFVPLIYISVFVPVPYCLDNCGFVVEPEVR